MTSRDQTTAFETQNLKQCCARLYESDAAKLLLGESFHPGGLELTERLGQLLQLTPKSRVLDVACGNGTSAIFLAERFGCEIVGIDFGSENVKRANDSAATKSLGPRVRFEQADAERMFFPDASFDAILSECAFCTFPNKPLAATEFARLLRDEGRVGIADLTREQELPKELDGLLAWLACIADAQPIEGYCAYFRAAGFSIQQLESHDEALLKMADQVRQKILVAELIVGLKELHLPGIDFTTAKQLATGALTAIQNGQLGYAIICAVKPPDFLLPNPAIERQ